MDPLAPEWRTLGDPGPDDGTPRARSEPPADNGARRLVPWVVAGILLIVGTIGLIAVAFAASSSDPSEVVVSGGTVTGVEIPTGGLPGAALADATGAPLLTTELIVDVEGAVGRPGLHRLPAGSRVGDAVAAAGGFAPRVDAVAAARTLNLAEPLLDGAKVVVPSLGDGSIVTSGSGPGAPEVTPGAGSVPGLIDINSADAATLESLPGIGPVTASEIIAARTSAPFASVDELLSRGVVGPATFEDIRALVTAGG